MPDVNGGTPMNLPVGIATITVNGQLLASDGTPEVGWVEWTPSVAVAYTNSDVVLLPKTVCSYLDELGKFSYVGPATDDPAGNPGLGRTCQVSEKMPGGRTFNVALPMVPGIKDYADLVAIPPNGGVPTTPVVTPYSIVTINGGTP